MDNGQDRFSTAERDVDLAARRHVVWNKVKHFLQNAKCMKVCFLKTGQLFPPLVNERQASIRNIEKVPRHLRFPVALLLEADLQGMI